MDFLIDLAKNIGPWAVAVEALFMGVIAVSLLIPGEQPEKFLQGVVSFLKKLSLK